MAHRTGDLTRDRILEVSLELFGRHGFDRTTVRAIAEGCGVTDAAIYYHFRSKSSILTAIWVTPPFRAISRRFVPGEPLTYQILDELVDSVVEGMAANDAHTRILVRSILSGDQTAHALRESNRAGMRQMFLPYFESVFDGDQATIRVDAFMMLMLGFIYSAQIDHGPRFVEISATPEFREEVKLMARLSVPLPVEAS
jgi:AcrR family transcriptional regulator